MLQIDIYVYLCICVHAYVYTCVYVYVDVCAYVCVRVHVYVHLDTHTCSFCLLGLRITWGSWPCWTRSAFGRAPCRMRLYWTSWIRHVTDIHTMRVADARRAARTSPFHTLPSGSYTMRAWSVVLLPPPPYWLDVLWRSALWESRM